VEPHLVQQALRGGHWLSPEAEAHVESAVARLWVEMKPRCIAIASAAEEMPHSNTDSHACIAKLWRTMDHLEDALVGGDAQVLLRCYISSVSLSTSLLCAYIPAEVFCEDLTVSLSIMGQFVVQYGTKQLRGTSATSIWGHLIEAGQAQWVVPNLADLETTHPLRIAPLNTFERKRTFLEHTEKGTTDQKETTRERAVVMGRSTTLTPFPEEKSYKM